MTRRLTTWAAVSAVSTALAISTHAGDAPSAGEVPFQLAGKVMFLKGSINGKGPYQLILDTGATETVITPPVAKALGVRTTAISAAQSKGFVKSLTVGGASVTNLGVYVFDPPQALSLRLDTGQDYHGLLGYTFVSRFLTTIDYARGCIRFDPLPPTKARTTSAGTNSIPFEVVEQLVRVPVVVNGAQQCNMLLDTGAAEVLFFPATARSLGLPAPTAAAPGPTFPRLRSLKLGNAEVQNVRAVVDNQADPRVSAYFAGILGYPFLSHFTLTLNYRDRILQLAPTGK